MHSKCRERKINKLVEAQELLQFGVPLQVPVPQQTRPSTAKTSFLETMADMLDDDVKR